MTALPGTAVGAGARVLRLAGGLLGALLVAWAAVGTADHLAQRTTEEPHSYAAPAALELVADGDVTVTTGGARVEVLARGTAGLATTSYSARESGGRLAVGHVCGGVRADRCVASLEVRVPEGVDVTVRSSSGAVSALDVDGDVDLATELGDVAVAGVSGRVRAASGSGDVDVRRAGGPVDASTDLGDVVVREADGDVVARSGSGEVDVRDAAGTVEAATDLGAVTVRGVAGDAVADSGSGRVDVAGVLGDVRATTDLGDVVVRATGGRVALDIATDLGRTTVEAPTDPGAARRVHIRSGSGDVAYLAGAAR